MDDHRAALREWQLASQKNDFSNDYDYYTLAIGYWSISDYQCAMEYYDRLVKAYPPLGNVNSLENRIANWTIKEKTAMHSVFILWKRAYIESKN